PAIMRIASKGKHDPITKQYSHTAPYLQDTLNQFTNDCMENALFYGVEEEPVVWRMVYYMLNPSEEFAPFGANNDDTIVYEMAHKEIQFRGLAEKAYKDVDREKALYADCARKWGY